MARGARTATTFAMACALALAIAAPVSAGKRSLYRGSGPKPGPSLLYEKPVTAPQLRNGGIWKAKPLLISGASAYRRGEFLYQDFLYDDHGARGSARDLSDPRTGDDTFSSPNGTYSYPTDTKKYRQNLADFVELRIKPRKRLTAFRITLSSMTDPALVATTIALGKSKTARELPYGANAAAPANRFLVVHGKSATLLRARDLKKLGKGRVTISKTRRQITVRIARKRWNPGKRKVRVAAAIGLWDEAANHYVVPESSATATAPGGASGLSSPTALFNVAFRYHEPMPEVTDIGGTLTDTAWWRDKQQGHSLADNDISPFFATVNFRKLRRGARDDLRGKPMGAPRFGAMNRIYSSRFHEGQGIDFNVSCGDPEFCSGQYLGRLQPYAIYVPKKRGYGRGRGLTLLLHSLGATYNQMQGSRNQSQFGERAKGNIVISSLSRGPDGWYYGPGSADVFEMWADVAKRFRLDPARSAIAGYSMGGYATFKLAAQFPDLFAAAQPTVGPPGLGIWIPPADPVGGGAPSNTAHMLASLRQIPFRIWNGTIDELVPVAGATQMAQDFDAAGLRYEWDLFSVADHFALAVNDQYQPAADFLGSRRVVRNPAHVSYVRNPSMDFAKLGTRADHAYWVSHIHLHDAAAAGGFGNLDAFSHAFGKGDPPVNDTTNGADVLSGGTFPAIPYLVQKQTWGKAPPIAKHKKLDLSAANIDRLTINVKRARLGCHPILNVTTDTPLKVRLAGCGRTLNFG